MKIKSIERFKMEEKQTHWPYIRVSPKLLERYSKEAQRRQLIPSRVKRGQDATKMGVLELLEVLITEAENG
jgi:hypothetical protein